MNIEISCIERPDEERYREEERIDPVTVISCEDSGAEEES